MITFNATTGLPNDCVVLDTETTGFEPQDGHRIVEIGAVRMRDGLPTGEEFHIYINPERSMPQGAFEVHGLSEAFLADKPTFGVIAADFVAFLGDLPFVAHNARFDFKFLNAELERAGLAPIGEDRLHDSVAAARRVYPGAQANLDALCRRLKIPLKNREKHGALIDAQLLAEVIVEMGGGRQQTLFGKPTAAAQADVQTGPVFTGPRPPALSLDADTIAAHQAFVAAELGSNALWAQFYATTPQPEDA